MPELVGRLRAPTEATSERATPLRRCRPKSARQASKKRYCLNIVLAHMHLIGGGHRLPPLVLLDEVAAHLDEMRRDALFLALARPARRCF